MPKLYILIGLPASGKSTYAKWLSEQIGRNPATVSKWCTNTVQPSMDALLDIANALEMNIQDLLLPTNKDK